MRRGRETEDKDVFFAGSGIGEKEGWVRSGGSFLG